jgi:hypothetical protein
VQSPHGPAMQRSARASWFKTFIRCAPPPFSFPRAYGLHTSDIFSATGTVEVHAAKIFNGHIYNLTVYLSDATTYKI